MRVAEWVAEQPLGPPAGGVRVPPESEGGTLHSLPALSPPSQHTFHLRQTPMGARSHGQADVWRRGPGLGG